ncbi:ATP synthase F0 subunit C [Candidatus Peregrinibacteria bacterium]|nr:ATP synthase F0 subunit C [Candidatus Peregrinibacteria bacterium]
MIPASLSMAIGIAAPAVAIAFIGSRAMDATARQPEAASKIQINMVLAIVFAEGLGILNFVLALLELNKK